MTSRVEFMIRSTVPHDRPATGEDDFGPEALTASENCSCTVITITPTECGVALPAFAAAQARNLRDVMRPVPSIQCEEEIKRQLAPFRMIEPTRQVTRRYGA